MLHGALTCDNAEVQRTSRLEATIRDNNHNTKDSEELALNFQEADPDRVCLMNPRTASRSRGLSE
jgi:hypothetical protein